MKNPVLILSVSLISLVNPLWGNPVAPGDEKVLETKISHVTVYPNGAQITRKAGTSLPQGESVLIVSGLSPFIDEQTVQVKGNGQFTILSVSPEKDYLENLEETDRMKSLRKQLRDINGKIDEAETMLGLLKEKESFLVANKVVAGKDQSLDAGNFKALYDFYVANMQQIREGILEKNHLLTGLKEDQAKLQQEINQLQSGRNLPTGRIRITVKADAPAQAALEINYMVNNAGWYPSYDIRVDSPNEPARLVYKASVYQNTGVEWKNVMLSFSNATPDRSGNIPELYPWYIDFLPENVSNVRPYAESARKAAPSARLDLEPLKSDSR